MKYGENFIFYNISKKNSRETKYFQIFKHITYLQWLDLKVRRKGYVVWIIRNG